MEAQWCVRRASLAERFVPRFYLAICVTLSHLTNEPSSQSLANCSLLYCRSGTADNSKCLDSLEVALEEYFVKNKQVGAIAGKVAQILASWTEGMLRDRA